MDQAYIETNWGKRPESIPTIYRTVVENPLLLEGPFQPPSKIKDLILTADQDTQEIIEAYLSQFEYARLTWINSLRENERDFVYPDKTAEERDDWVKMNLTRWRNSARPRVNYNDDWDGVLIKRVVQLDRAGFEILDMMRRQKIRMRKPKDMTLVEITQVALAAVSEKDITGLSFKNGFYMWWKSTSPKHW